MPLTDEEISDILRTEILNFRITRIREKRERINELRRKRINEAVDWEGGESVADPRKIVIDETDEAEVFFLKPGKEVNNEKNPNPHDMTPKVGELYTGFTFQDTWAILLEAGVRDFERFKFLLVLVYRSAYLLDHEEVDKGKVRYKPNEDIMEVIEELDTTFNGIIPGGVHELLHFLDILAWNEDVKYQSGVRGFELEGNFYVGRINNMLSTIGVPYKFMRFINDILEHAQEPEKINFGKGLETSQSLSQRRGTAKPTQAELEEWFSPTLYNPQNTL